MYILINYHRVELNRRSKVAFCVLRSQDSSLSRSTGPYVARAYIYAHVLCGMDVMCGICFAGWDGARPETAEHTPQFCVLLFRYLDTRLGTSVRTVRRTNKPERLTG